MATEAPIVPAQGKKWFKGDDVKLRWTESNGNDITGWTIKFGMAKTKGGTLVLEKSCAIDDGPNSIYSATIEDGDTDDLEVGTYFYETKRLDAGYEAILSYGTVELLQPVGVS